MKQKHGGLLALALLLPAMVWAGPRPEPLNNGMSMHEVLQVWGAPKEKIEQEARQKQIWIYPKEREVIFREGKVEKWTHPQFSAVVPAPVEMAPPPAQQASNDVVVEEILSEIMREGPGEDEPKKKKSSKMLKKSKR